jgi:hypothetical protein
MMAIESDSPWDLSVTDRHGQLTLLVEVRRKIKASPQWAAKLRCNIFAHGTFPNAPYFLMVFPDQFYLWANGEDTQEAREPTYTIDPSPILQPYCQRAGVILEEISRPSLELMIVAWLGEIIHGDRSPEEIDTAQQWLIESGLYFALTGGQFAPLVAA